MNLSGVTFLDVSEVIRVHEEGVQAAGGSLGVRDHGLLASAVEAPRTTVFGMLAYPSLARMAAALAYSLARNHAFVDGNKRAAVTAAVLFLDVNGFTLRLGPEWEETFVQVAAGFVTREDLAAGLAREMGGDIPIEEDDP